MGTQQPCPLCRGVLAETPGNFVSCYGCARFLEIRAEARLSLGCPAGRRYPMFEEHTCSHSRSLRTVSTAPCVPGTPVSFASPRVLSHVVESTSGKGVCGLLCMATQDQELGHRWSSPFLWPQHPTCHSSHRNSGGDEESAVSWGAPLGVQAGEGRRLGQCGGQATWDWMTV